MKIKIDYKSKKTIIAVIAVIALFAVAFAGGYAYIKSNDQSTAAPNETTNNDGQNTSEDGNNQTELPDLGDDEQNNNSEDVNNEENNTSNTENNSQSSTTVDDETSTGTTSTEDATTVFEEVVIGEKLVAEDSKIRWTPENLIVPNTELNLTKSNLTVMKKAVTETTNLEGNNLAQAGDVIDYTIEITNNGEENLEKIEVSDIVPEGTTFESIEDETAVLVKEVSENEEEVVTKIIWTLDVEAGKTVAVKFAVKVNEDATGTITNVAIANGEESQEQHIAIIETEKTSVINNDEEIEEAKVGDEITYTISVKNTGNVAGNVLVKDEDLVKILENAELVSKIFINEEETEYTAENLEDGIVISVNEESTSTITFTVKVKTIDGEIKNIALIGEQEKPTDPEIVDTIDMTVSKTISNEPANGTAYVLGETVRFKVTVANIGSVALENVEVDDQLEGARLVEGTAIIERLEANTSVDLIYEYEIKQKDLEDVEGTTVLKNTVVVTSDNGPEKEADVDVPTDVKNPDYKVEKAATLNKKEGNTAEGKAELGDTIHYVVKVINTGNVDLENITVTDTMLDENGKARTATVSVTVAEGEKVALEYDYVVTQDDVNNKETIYNKVTSGDEEDETNTPVVEKDSSYELEKIARLNKKDGNTAEGKAELGDTIHYVVKVINTGNVDLENITVTDTMLDEDGNARTATVSVTVAEKSKVALEYDYTVTQADVNNKETIYNKVTSGDKEDETNTPVVEKDSSYELEKIATLNKKDGNTAEGKAELGDTIHYVVKVINTGNVDLENITVTDTMLDENGNARTATVNVTVAEGEKVALEYDYTVTQDDVNDKETIYNKVTSGDEEDETNTPVVEKDSSYELEKIATLNKKDGNTAEGKAELGDTIHYVVKVINTGNVDLENITVTDTMLDEDGNARTATVSVTVAEGEKVALEYDYTVTQADVNNKETIYNKVTSGNEEDETNTPVVEKDSSYELEKIATLNKKEGNTAEGKAELGDTIHYVVKVINTGNVDLENITVTDTMLDENGKARTATVNVTVAEGSKIALEYDYTVTQDDVNDKETIYNKVTSGDEEDETNTPVVEKDSSYELEKIATLNKKDGNTAEGKAELGDTIHYVVKVINTGNVDLENITVTDTMLDEDGNARTATVSVTVAEGEKVALEYDYTVTQADVNNKETIYNKVTSGNEEDETNTPVVEKDSSYELQKTAVLKKKAGNLNKNVAELGDTIHYVVKVINTGNVDLENITVTDTMLDENGKARTATVSVTVAEKSKVALEYDYTVTQADVNNKETIYNKVTSGNEEDETNTPVVEKDSSYELEKIATLEKLPTNTAEGKAELGDTIHYVVKVINTGNVDLENITVTDTMKDEKGNARTATVSVTVAEGSKVALEYDYTVTQDDVNDKTTIYNKVTSGDEEDETNTPVVEKNPSYTVTKSAIVKRNGIVVTAKNEDGNVIVKANDVITYTITVTNTGNVTLKDLVLNDEMLGITDRKLADIGVGNHLDINETYTVTQQDIIAQENITNIAYVSDKPSNPVVVVPDDIRPEISKTVDKLHAEYGDILTYKIKIKSIADIEQNILIEDTIDTNKVEFVPGSIKWDGEAVADSAYSDGKITYETKISGVNVEKILEFKVKVISISVGEIITNTAYVNEEPTSAVTTTITKEVCVKYDAITENPLDVILVLDTSGSMANNSRMTNLKAAAKGIVNILFPAAQDTGSTISLIKFANSATLIGTYTGSQRDTLLGTSTIKGEIDKLSSSGGTNEYAALDTTLNLLQGSTLTNTNKIVIFLSDGAATTGSTYDSQYAGGLINTNNDYGFDNNTRTNIENKAEAIKAISGVTVYSVGLGIDSLATNDRAWVESCSPISVTGTTETSGNTVTFTVTVTNSSATSIVVPTVEAELSGVNMDSISVTGGSRNYTTAVWSNITVPANSSVTLTATATKYDYSHWEPSIEVEHNYSSGTTCTNSNHTGIPFTDTVTQNSQVYHYMNTKAWGTYTLSKIATSAATFEKVEDSNDVTTLTNTFANIIRREVSGTKTAYADSMPVVIEIDETHTIIGNITVTIGNSSNTYTQAQLENGVNGLVYTPGVGFVWTISDSTMLYKELSLSYAY